MAYLPTNLRISFTMIILCIVCVQSNKEEPLPFPHLLILGATGVGKSTLADVLLGEDPNCENCTFPICPGGDSCTKETKFAAGRWLGESENFTVVDTPGFGDSDHEDELLDEMIVVLKESVKSTNGFVILFNGEDERFNESIQQMLRAIEGLFGKSFWNQTFLGVSHWAYDERSVRERNFTGKNEDWWTATMNEQLQKKFHLEFDLEAVFIDAYAKQEWNIDDEDQQEAFDRETEKLWSLYHLLPDFEFKSMEDILEELHDAKEEIDYLNNIIEKNITELQKRMDVEEMENIERKMEINLLDTEVLDNDRSIKSLDVRLSNNEEKTSSNTGIFNDKIMNFDCPIDGSSEESGLGLALCNLQTQVNQLEFLPLGSILPWVMKPSIDTNSDLVAQLPEGWMRCDGSIIPEPSIWQGLLSPNLNNEGWFLRGGSDTEALNKEDDQIQDHMHTDPGHTHGNDAHSHVYGEWYSVFSGSGSGDCLPGAQCIHYEYGGSKLNNQVWTTRTSDPSLIGIHNSNSGIGGVEENYRKGSETRPKNMKVVYIMKIF